MQARAFLAHPEVAAGAARVFDRAKALGEGRPILEGLELRLRIRIVIGDMRAAVLALTLRRRLQAAQAISSAAATWLVFVLLNKQAFCNYDWLGAGLLGTAAAATVRERPTR